MNKNLRVSIVIPVYNEAAHLGACLQSIAAQSAIPYEVIVVDNNSSDETIQVAKRFPFVTLIRESRQGVVYARDRGFNAASGEIIGRIDGDTILGVDWVSAVQRAFTDQSLGAVTGKVSYHDMAGKKLVDTLDLYFRRRFARLLGREVALQGANMAIRRTVWQTVRHDLCHAAGLHEDFDLAIHTNWRDYSVRFNESLAVSVGYRQNAYNLRAFSCYALASPRTYALHGLKSQRHMYPVVALVIVGYPILNLLHRGYDAQAKAFSWQQAFAAGAPARVNPVTFVD
jgi:glycosyltransferase involved in cell wall biosynthesis